MKPFTRLCVLLLSVIAGLQLVRFLAGWPITIDGFDVPVWVSAVAAAIAGALAAMLWRESRR